MDTDLNRTHFIVSFLFQIIAAVIMLQSTYYKLTGAEESIWIFTHMGAEPHGRIGTALLEIIASILLVYPPLVWLGAILSMGVMAGAILSHVFILGIEILGDGGLLFGMALATFLSSAIALYINRYKLYSVLLRIEM